MVRVCSPGSITIKYVRGAGSPEDVSGRRFSKYNFPVESRATRLIKPNRTVVPWRTWVSVATDLPENGSPGVVGTYIFRITAFAAEFGGTMPTTAWEREP